MRPQSHFVGQVHISVVLGTNLAPDLLEFPTSHAEINTNSDFISTRQV